jgi:hypothetical protein
VQKLTLSLKVYPDKLSGYQHLDSQPHLLSYEKAYQLDSKLLGTAIGYEFLRV